MEGELHDKIHKKDSISWAMMIAGYAIPDYGKESLPLFEEMKQSGMSPDCVTILDVFLHVSIQS